MHARARLSAALAIATGSEDTGKLIVVVFPDTRELYLSTRLLENYRTTMETTKPHDPATPGNAAAEDGQLASLVAALCEANGGLGRPAGGCPGRQPLPSRDVVIDIVEALRTVLFPGYFGASDLTAENTAFHLGSTLDRIRRNLQEQIRRGLCFACDNPSADPGTDCDARAESITRRFLAGLPATRRILATDVQASYEGDPAATCPDEAIFCYPGVLAITNYRLAN